MNNLTTLCLLRNVDLKRMERRYHCSGSYYMVVPKRAEKFLLVVQLESLGSLVNLLVLHLDQGAGLNLLLLHTLYTA